MGVVYKAYDPVTRRHVAIKTMRGSIDPAALELFSKEWTVLSRINHPNIVDLFDTGEFEEDGQKKPFFVMPFLQGNTLDYLIKNGGLRLTVERVIDIIIQTCRGLQAAHENGLVHRDLKPSNIFVMDDDSVKIIDFGVVYLAGSDTVTGLKGTLQYMAPEQIDMKPTSPASDIFSLGVVCYEALSGRKPFARRTEAETVEALRRHTPPPVGELNPLVSQLVSRVIHKAMAKAPYHRFSSAKEFSETLQKALANQPIERFDKAKTQPRIERAKKALAEGDLQFGSELLSELEAEGHLDPEMTVLRIQINQGIRQKSIRQLLEMARSRREENEFPLALQKIQDVLEIDPDNADALSLRQDVEKEMSNRQVENWFRLVEQHIHHRSFAQAREALQEILKLDSKNSRACELLVDVERREKEMNRIRGEKEQLYKAALNNYEKGEVSSALSKLERVLEFSRTAPDSETPDRDAQYQRLYDQIRTERDAARNAYATGRRYLSEKNFDKALEICDEYLKRYPTDALFQALKLEIEENKRYGYSSFLAGLAQRADAEPDLDRRVNILKEAVERYPDEAHFQQSLRLTRERRDLVNAIVARARQYEDRGQFGDALSQWDILRNIHAQYPGIGFEVERLTRRRDEQLREETKARWVAQIDQMRAAGDYTRARELVRAALAEFPQDRELGGLDKLTQQDLERAKEAETWLQRGQKLCFEHAYGEGLAALRKASELDGSNPVIRAALLNALVEQARSVLGQDWRAAEPLVLEALRIDGSNPVVRGLEGLVLDYKRKEMVDDSLARARDLQASGDLPGALKVVEEALRSFPSELRLVQLRDTLRKSLPAKETPPPVDERPAVPVSDIPPEPKASATAVNSMGPSDTSMLDHSLNKTVLYPSGPVAKESAKPTTPLHRDSDRTEIEWPQPNTEAASKAELKEGEVRVASRSRLAAVIAVLAFALLALVWGLSEKQSNRLTIGYIGAITTLIVGAKFGWPAIDRLWRFIQSLFGRVGSVSPQYDVPDAAPEVQKGEHLDVDAGPSPDAAVSCSPGASDRTVLADGDSSFSLPPLRGSSGGGGPPGDFTQFLAESKENRPRASLIVISCPDSFLEGTAVFLNSFPFVIGRNARDMSISADATLSREQACISWTGSCFAIRDLASTNGTYIDGRRLPPEQDVTLFFNSEVRLSTRTRLRFRGEISELPEFSGQTLNQRYYLRKCLRASRKSAFYEAEDTRPSRKVAVKLLSPSLSSYPGYLEQFEREAATAARLSHPNICKIYEYGQAPLVYGPGREKETYYICMQILDGGSLADRLDASDHALPESVASWLDVVAQALQEAHGAGVAHAGLKPTSIVFSATGTPYVTDFAIAIIGDVRDHRQLFLGAPDYIAPEQWEGLVPTGATDQYSLAALAYRMLTGTVPFDDQINPERRAQNFQRDPVAADALAAQRGRPEVNRSISQALARALSVRPEERFSSIVEFAQAFRAALGQRIERERKLRVFLSYRRQQSSGWAAFFADKLAERHGLEVFVDRQRVDKAGDRVPEKIQRAIADCDCFVCLIANQTLKSAWVLDEIRLAVAAGKPMIPVVEESFKKPKGSGLPEHVESLLNCEEVRLFADYDEGAIKKLADMIHARHPHPPQSNRPT
jgi:serine/threonine protein kinase